MRVIPPKIGSGEAVKGGKPHFGAHTIPSDLEKGL